jgi:dipeptidyl aminopeptidase/acylaminoacyl peptidase
LHRNLRVFVGLLLLAAGGMLFLSCGDDETTTAPCTNCDYWEKALGRNGRYPAGSPTDPDLIAFCDTMDLSGSAGAGEMYWHIWVARRADTTRYYQITKDATFDLRPVWSPDGTKIAFERGHAGARDVYVVDVTDLENPGVPFQFTDNEEIEESNSSPAWITVNGAEQWLAFTNSTNGGSDIDVLRLAYPAPGDPVDVTYDPADFAVTQGGVLGYVFKDKQVGSNGSRYVTFASPDRTPVGDLYVVAQSEEESDTANVHARVFVNGTDSESYTPVVFEYRPVQDTVLIEGQLDGYCSLAVLSYSDMEADSVSVALLDFQHTHGNLAVASIPGSHRITVGEITWERDEDLDSTIVDTVWVEQQGNTYEWDPDDPQYRVYTCIPADTVLVFAASVYGPCSDTVDVVVTAGDTAYVVLSCETGITAPGSSAWRSSGERVPVLGQQPEPYSLWLVDVDTEALYLIAEEDTPISNPAISPDGRYIAFVVGESAERTLKVAGDVQAFIAGTEAIRIQVIGLPGSSEDIECYRFPERVSWVYDDLNWRLLASLSVCRDGQLLNDYEVWEADLDRFLD